MNREYINATSPCRVAQMPRCGTKAVGRWGAVVSVLGVIAVMASGVDASGCAMASYETTSTDVPPFADNNFMVSSETSLSGVQTMTLSNKSLA